MSNVELEVEVRTEIGKNKIKPLKKNGRIPAIIYGSGMDPLPISVELRNLLKVYNRSALKRNALIDLKISGQDEPVLVISHQFAEQPVTGQIIHVDFMKVEKGKTVFIEVPCKLIGTAKGQKLGGVLIQNLNYVKLSCLPREIPQEFDINIENVDIGESIRVSEIPTEGSVKILNDPRDIVMHVEAPRVEVEPVVEELEEDAVEGEEAVEGAEAVAGDEKGESAATDEASSNTSK